MYPSDVATWPWPVMAVSPTGAVCLSRALSELLGVDAVPPPREAAGAVDADAAFWLDVDKERRELRWAGGVGLPDGLAQGLEGVGLSSPSVLSQASRSLEITEAPRLESTLAHCAMARRLVPLGF